MADLATFAKRIRRRGRKIETEVDEAVVKAAIAINQSVVMATPVDTGRARANWQASIGTPITAPTGEEDPSGPVTVARNNAVIAARSGSQTIYISNNVDYIGELNRGSSSQAPANFVELAVQAGLDFLRRSRVVGNAN